MRNTSIMIIAVGLLTASVPSWSQLPTAKNVAQPEQVPGVFRMQLGDYTITALSDGTVTQNLHDVLTNTTRPETERLLRRSFLSNPVEASINAYLIETGQRRILVDTGAGSLFLPAGGGKLLRALATAGVRPEQIDEILITHIHTDHSGGLTVGGRMLFPNATIHAGQADIDFFLTPANASGSGYAKRFFDEAQATVGPYARAGRLRGFTRREQLMPGVTAIPTPGHTPGHAFYKVESRGVSIEFWGDIMHFGAIQFPRPNVTVTYDRDAPAAAVQRRAQFRRGDRERRLVAFAHVNFPGIGHIRSETGGGYAWIPVEYRDKPAAAKR